MSQRLTYIDVAKTFAIWCVLCGHLLQNIGVGYGDYDPYHDSWLFQFIYSFHMPLFLTLSGMFMYKAFALDTLTFLRQRGRQLLIPVLSFATLFYLFHNLLYVPFIDQSAEPQSWWHIAFESYQMWFLKYLFAGYLISYISIRLIRCDVWAAIIPTIILVFCFRIGIFRVLPFLWLGYFMHKYIDKLHNNCWQTFFISGILFAATLFFWQGDYDATRAILSVHGGAITFNGYNMIVTLERIAVGASGSVFFIILAYIICRIMPQRFTTLVSSIGMNTLGIYCLQIYLLEETLSHFTICLTETQSILVSVVIAVLYLIVLNKIVIILNKNKITAFLLLGR